MSYGGWSAFIAENGLQVGAVTAVTLLSGERQMAMRLLHGAMAGVATDVAFNGVRMLNLNRGAMQAGVGMGTVVAVDALGRVMR